ncbi:hypothetical protein [Pleionea sediminis]|uniref:hypothetical protein n=1 Tax=Pleionea sediminis TaxID=2569479 RepID=UPI00197BFFAF|nr:hypothetical protein [Pleionea sediminis]
MSNAVSLGQELLNVPFPEMVKNLGVGIAEAQLELDMVSTRIAQLMTGQPVNTDEDESNADEDSKHKVYIGTTEYSLLELGFTPTFYQFVDTIIEVKMAVSVKRETSQSRSTSNKTISGKVRPFRGSASISVSSVNASYSSKYQYSAEGSSLMRTKLVPVPPPQTLEDILKEYAKKDTL